jgi:hypothetical protein
VCAERSTATYLSTRRLSKPERPPAGKGVFDVEILLVVENSDRLRNFLGLRPVGIVLVLSVWGDGDGAEVDLFRHDGLRLRRVGSGLDV